MKVYKIFFGRTAALGWRSFLLLTFRIHCVELLGLPSFIVFDFLSNSLVNWCRVAWR
jgi:hypothetical protein